MQIKVVGLPCTKTSRTYINARAAASEFSQRLHVRWVNDVHEIAEMGSLSSPAVIVNEKLKQSGRIPSVHEIKLWIQKELTHDEIT